MKRRNFIRNAAATTAGAVVIPTIVPSSVFGKSAPSNKINIGQIGCGRIARSHDMRETLRYDVARMVAVSDVDSKRMADGKKLVEDYYKEKGTSVDVKMYGDFRRAAELVRNGRIGRIHTVKIGLPGDPSGPVFEAGPVPSNLNFDMWLGSTPEIQYKEKLVHPQDGYSRPGWLRHENYGAGMITGWGQHHYDSAAWGMNTEYTGPISVEAVAQFPKSGDWNVHGDFMVKHEYANGITVYTSGGYPNGIRYIGDKGWVFVTRGAYRATASDPIPEGSTKALDASDPEILKSKIGEDEIHLYESDEQHGNWLDCVQSRKQPISPVEIGHRACTVCLISHIAMKVPGIHTWNPESEKFVDNDLANSMLSRPQRYPYGTNYINI